MKTQFVVAEQRPTTMKTIAINEEPSIGDVNIFVDGQIVAWFSGSTNQLIISSRFLKDAKIGLQVTGHQGESLLDIKGE